MLRPLLLIICGFTFVGWGESLRLDGHVLDPQGNPVAGASIHLLVGKEDLAQTKSGNHGQFEFDGLVAAIFTVRAEAPEFVAAAHTIALSKSQDSISSFESFSRNGRV